MPKNLLSIAYDKKSLEMTNHHVLLSHDSRDNKIAHTLKELLSKITLGQLEIWFSSDSSPSGGITPGEWYRQIHDKLENSNVVIVLLTPKSINNRWIHFEAGFGAATECQIIPVCIGVGIDDVPAPLNRYQCYHLSDYKSLKTFVGKTLEINEIKFDEELTRTILEKNITIFAELSPSNIETREKIENLDNAVTEIKSYIDDRLLKSKMREQKHGSYSIKIQINLKTFQRDVYLTIRDTMTVQNVLDDIYNFISNYVPMFTYMEKWILQDIENHKRLIIREVGDLIPAPYIFRKNSSWSAMSLNEPYDIKQSLDVDRWYSAEQNHIIHD